MKRFALGLALTLLGVGAAGGARAQMAYTRTSFAGAYAPISTGTGASTLSFPNLDDGTTSIPLPFAFQYAGTAYSTSNFLAVCTNGYGFLSLSSVSTPFSSLNTNLFTTTTPNSTLAPWWDDLSTAAVGANPAGTVLYQTQGTPGSRTLTVQWTNISAYSSTSAGQPRTINFQLVLIEGTNVVEFRYGTTSGAGSNSSESASIGIEDATGGDGHYLDGITGSSHVNNGMMTTLKWPTRSLRFTPGTPSALPAGEYTVGPGGDYVTPTDAFADLNQRGVAGEISLVLTDSLYVGPATTYPLLLGPVVGASALNTVTILGSATLRAEGTASGNCGNTTLTSAISTSNEPIIGLIGADYITLKGLVLQTEGAALVDRGVLVGNTSGVDGAGHNTLRDLSISLSRGNVNALGIQQVVLVTPSLSSGVNSFNVYQNIVVTNAAGGIHLVGYPTIPDANCEVGALSPGGTVIGAATANDIGNGTAQVTGIRAASQSAVRIYNCEIRNLTGTGTNTVEAIHLENLGSTLVGVGTCEIFGNRIHGLRSTNAAAGIVRGIRANLTGNSGSFSRIYNNFVHDLSSSSTVTSSRRVIGIGVQDAGNGAAATHQVDFNSVRLSPTGLLCSNTCFEIGTVTGPKLIVRNNIFANFTAAQGGSAKHFAFSTPASTSIGPAGSLSDRNDLYVNATTNGAVGLTSVTDRPTLSDWQAVIPGLDANSQAGNPQFTSATDLHILPGSPTPVESSGSFFGGSITWVGTDFDDETRNGATPDLGADEGAFTTLAADDVSAFGIDDPNGMDVKVAGTPFTPRASFQNVGTNAQGAVPVRIRVTGPNPALTEIYNATAMSPPLAVAGPPIEVAFPAITIAVAGTYTVHAISELPSDSVPANNEYIGTFVVVGPLAGTYHVGAAQAAPFNSLTAAIERLNLVGVSAPVALLLDDTTYQAPAETFPLVIQPFNGSGPGSRVTIAPAAGKNPTITGSVTGAVLQLNGADFVTLDGSNSGGTSRNLTVANTSTSALTAAVWLSSIGPGAGATDNVIRNCTLRGGADQRSSANETFGILASGSTLSPFNDGADNDRNTFQNNAITAVRWGIFLRGAALNPNDDCVVADNLVGPANFGSGQIGRGGIVLQHQNGTLVSRNEVRFVGVLITDAAVPSDRVGIGVGDYGWLPAALTATNIQVVGNRIHDIIEEKRFSAAGIVLTGDGAPSGNLVANNMIYAVRSNGTSNDQAVGIGIAGGNGDRVVFNSISLGGDLDPTGAQSAVASGCGIRISGTGPVDLTLKNNAVSVDFSSNTGTLHHFGIVAPSAAFDWGSGGCNNNDYFVNGANPQMVMGGVGTTTPYAEVPTIAGWRTQFTPNQDALSLAADPRFVGASDLHVGTAGPVVSPLSRAGAPIPGVGLDFDGEAGLRATMPDIGADEFATFILATAVVGSGSVAAVPPGPEFNPGQQTQLTATPADTCTMFLGWSGGASGATNPLTVTMSADRNITATFGPRLIVVTASAGPGGGISPSGAVNVSCGGDTTFTIVPDSCHVILDVLVDGVSVGPQASVTLTNVTAAHSISASFGPRAFTVTTNAGPDGIVFPAGIDTLLCGDSLTVVVTPDTCFRIDQLLVDGESVPPPATGPASIPFHPITGNHTVSATFVLRLIPIVATAGPGGTIVPQDTTEERCGSDRLFLVLPDSCHTIADVLVDGQSVGAVSSYAFIDAEEPHTIHATFSVRSIPIAASAGAGGAIAPSGTVNVPCGADTTFAILPDSCHVIADVLVDGLSVGPQAVVTLTNVTAARTISASFALRPFTVTTSAGPGGSIFPAGIDTLLCGDSLTVVVSPDSCFRIDELQVDGQSVPPPSGGPASVVFNGITADHVVAATFILRTFPIVATVGAGGMIVPPDTAAAACGSNRLYVIVPDSCHTIADVVVDGQSVGAVTSHTFVDVQEAHTIHATFNPILFQIIGSTDGLASLSPGDTVVVPCGAIQNFSVTPAPCRAVADVLVNGISIGAVTSFSVGPVHADQTIMVMTAPGGTATITASATAGGSIVPSGAIPVNCGTDTTFTYAPNPGYGVADVLIDGASIRPADDYTFFDVAAPHTIHVVFIDAQPPVVHLTSPNGGEGWAIGSVNAITWTATDNVGITSVALEYSLDSGANWIPIVSGLANSGSYAWTTPLTPSTHARVRVIARDAASLAVADRSDADFVLADQSGVAFLPAELTRPLLLQNRPNPFNPTTRIGFGLPTALPVQLTLYAVDGRRVRTLLAREFPAGYSEVEWDGRDDEGRAMPSGVYFYRFEAGSVVETRRLVIGK